MKLYQAPKDLAGAQDRAASETGAGSTVVRLSIAWDCIMYVYGNTLAEDVVAGFDMDPDLEYFLETGW